MPTGKLAAGKMTVTSSNAATSWLALGTRLRGGHVTWLVPALYVPPPVADWNTAPAGNVSTNVTPLRFWLPPAANVIPTRYVYGVSTCGGTPAGTTFFVTVQSDAARDVTITWFEVTGLALDARIVP